MQRIPSDEESRGILRKIIERQAYRMLMLANIRGHGIKYFTEVKDKLRMGERMTFSLRQFQELERIYAEVSDRDVVSIVRGRMERIPYPASRMELAVCLFLCVHVERHALAAYVESSVGDLAALARSRLEALPDLELPADGAFALFCAEGENLPLAQQQFERWLTICLLSLGRPSSAGAARAVELGLRTRQTSEIVLEFLAGLAPFLRACSLHVPAAEALGVELPEAWTSVPPQPPAGTASK